MWVVKDPRATAIGDEVTLMKQIPEQFKGFQVLERNPWINRFFAFMRPSFNNAGNVFDRTPLKVFTEQYRDIVEIGSAESAQRWNLTLDELPRARDEMVGRMALGTTLAGIVWGLALNGHIIGDYPADEADRKFLLDKAMEVEGFLAMQQQQMQQDQQQASPSPIIAPH